MSDEHDEHDEHDAHQNRAGKGYNTLAKITVGGAIVGGAVFAMTKFVSVWKNGEAKKRKFTDWFPNAIDDSAQSFKQAFAALSSDNTELEHSNESGETEDDKMIVGFAYGANAERQQWFNAQWHETSENSVRVEYLSTMNGEKSCLVLPSQRKTIIPKIFVRVDAPANASESPDGDD
jgi:hypothetical protein